MILAQKQDALNLSVEKTMPVTEVTLCLRNLQFGFANSNVNSTVFILRRNYVIDTGGFVEEALPLTINVSVVEKKLISCFMTISTATNEFNTIFDILSYFF